MLVVSITIILDREVLHVPIYKKLLDEDYAISRIIKVEVGFISEAKSETDNPYRDLDYYKYHKNQEPMAITCKNGI